MSSSSSSSSLLLWHLLIRGCRPRRLAFTIASTVGRGNIAYKVGRTIMQFQYVHGVVVVVVVVVIVIVVGGVVYFAIIIIIIIIIIITTYSSYNDNSRKFIGESSNGATKVFMNKRHIGERTFTTSLVLYMNEIYHRQGILTRSSKSSESGIELLLKAMRIPPESNPNKKTRLW